MNVRGETVAILSVEPDRTTYATGDGRRLELQDKVTLIRKDSNRTGWWIANQFVEEK